MTISLTMSSFQIGLTVFSTGLVYFVVLSGYSISTYGSDFPLPNNPVSDAFKSLAWTMLAYIIPFIISTLDIYILPSLSLGLMFGSVMPSGTK